MKDKNKNLTSSEKIAAKTEGFFARNYRLLIIILVLIVVPRVCLKRSNQPKHQPTHHKNENQKKKETGYTIKQKKSE